MIFFDKIAMVSYRWTLKDADFQKDRGRVLSCFSAGGGSTMGYKLAGFDVIGCVEIDPRMMDMYKVNHNPKYSYLMGIQDFKNLDEYPSEFYDLDILDGSPPCSSFSMVGARERDWGKEKKFREGQKKQVLDTLFFDFIYVAERLKPKVVISENVQGIVKGKAIEYTNRIIEAFSKAGYHTQYFLVDAKDMGVPQTRKRIIFISLRKDLIALVSTRNTFSGKIPSINMTFQEKEIPVSEILTEADESEINMTEATKELWRKTKHGKDFSDAHPKGHWYGYWRLCNTKPAPTITTKLTHYHPLKERHLTYEEMILASSFPLDYKFNGNPIYTLGMSVPPLMMYGIVNRIYEKWSSIFKK